LYAAAGGGAKLLKMSFADPKFDVAAVIGPE
jgi:hypothetical protein